MVPNIVSGRSPFHAARDGRTFPFDKDVSSYTPTLKALVDARLSPSTNIRPASHPRLLVVGQTNSDLASARPELGVPQNLGPFVECFDVQDATRSSVLSRLPSHEWEHFIYRGTLASSPFDLSLHLHDGDKLSPTILSRRVFLTPKFAFLAACHTAEQTQTGLTDEILHLAGVMQSNGFRSVVGTMWTMVDKDGP